MYFPRFGPLQSEENDNEKGRNESSLLARAPECPPEAHLRPRSPSLGRANLPGSSCAQPGCETQKMWVMLRLCRRPLQKSLPHHVICNYHPSALTDSKADGYRIHN